MQNRHGSGLPPIWNVTCARSVVTREVNVYEYALPDTLTCGVASKYVSYGGWVSPTTARATCPSGLPVAKNSKRYDSPSTRSMSFCPTATSQRLIVPPGTSTQARPSVTVMGMPAVDHHGSM